MQAQKKKKKRFEKLLMLMSKESSEVYWEKLNSRYVISDAFENALLGTLEDRGENSGYYNRFFPDFSLEKAPKLIAALFPKVRFSYRADWEYSVGGGVTVLMAEHENGKLTIKECQTDDDEDLLTEEEREQYDECELGTEDVIWRIMSRRESVEVLPELDKHYIRSFYDGEDLAEDLE